MVNWYFYDRTYKFETVNFPFMLNLNLELKPRFNGIFLHTSLFKVKI